MISPFGEKKDSEFMAAALEQARHAFEQNEVPIGAVVVDAAGQIIGRGYNAVEGEKSQAAHAEIRAMQQATAAQGDWRLDGCWVFVTLEPCSMCMHALQLSRVAGVLYAAASPLFGYHLDKEQGFRVYKYNIVSIGASVGAHESSSLLRNFFKDKRNKSSE